MKSHSKTSTKTTHVLCLGAYIVFLILLFVVLPSCQKDNLLPQESLNGVDKLSTTIFSNSTPVLYFGHKKFTRITGAPFIVTQKLENPDFDHFDGNFTLKIQNGSDKKTRVSSAEIWIDGALIVGPSDFSKNTALITKQLKSLTPESILEVKLNSTPGSFIDLWIEGTLKLDHALITSEGGTFSFLGGTLVVSVPPNALDASIFISIRDITTEIPDYFKSENCKALEFLPDGLLFKLPILAILNLESIEFAEIPKLWQIDKSTGYLKLVNSYFDRTKSALSFELMHFSDYVCDLRYIPDLKRNVEVTYDLINGLPQEKIYPDGKYTGLEFYNLAFQDVKRAFDKWSTYSLDFGVSFRPSRSDPNIKILFYTAEEADKLFKNALYIIEDKVKYEVPGIVLYHGPSKTKFILLNMNLKWNTSNLYSTEDVNGMPNRAFNNVEGIVTHEIGHFFGFNDVYNSKLPWVRKFNNRSIMGNMYTGGYPTTIFKYDLENLKEEYNIDDFSYTYATTMIPVSEELITPNNHDNSLTQPIKVKVIGSNGKGVKNVTVVFMPIGNNKLQIISNSICVTNDEGVASVDRFSIPSAKGSYEILAQIWRDPSEVNKNENDGNDIKKTVSFKISYAESSPFKTESHQLNDNLVPAGWEFFESNETVALRDGHLIATPVDAYGGLRRKGTMPGGYSKIIFEWDGNLMYSYWGMLNILKVNYGDNKDFAAYLETAGAWSSTENYLFLQQDFGSGQPTELKKYAVPLKYGTFHYKVTVSNSEITFLCKDKSTGQEYVNKPLPIPNGFTLQQMKGYEFITYTTTDNDNWLDNISVTLIR